MDETVDTALSSDGGNVLGTLGVDIIVTEVPAKPQWLR